MLHLLSTAGTGLGIGEPWDSLIKASGAMLVLVLVALWRELLFLPGVVREKDKRIAEKDAEIVRLRESEVETTKWLQNEAIPLVATSTALIEKLTEKTKAR